MVGIGGIRDLLIKKLNDYFLMIHTAIPEAQRKCSRMLFSHDSFLLVWSGVGAFDRRGFDH